MTKRTLLVLHDSPAFGGHERMFLRLLPGLVERRSFDRILVRYPESNEAFRKALAPFLSPCFEAAPWPFEKRRAEPWLAPFRRRYARAVRALVATEQPSTLLLLQGRIENCAVPLLKIPRGLPVVSYIPMAHGMREIGRRGVLGIFPGDVVRRRLYRRPDHFIVPSRAVAAQLAAAGARADVTVADNTVAPPLHPGRYTARRAIGLEDKAKMALILGRLDIRQKGLDTLAAAIRTQASRLSEWTVFVVGDGEGARLIDRLAQDVAPWVGIRRIGWTDDPHFYLAAADLLLMPSRWEGMPLTMLEAFAYGVPVLGSRIDVFEDRLPAGQCIDYATADLAAAFAAACCSPIHDGRNAATLEDSRSAFASACSPASQSAFKTGDMRHDSPISGRRDYSHAQ